MCVFVPCVLNTSKLYLKSLYAVMVLTVPAVEKNASPARRRTIRTIEEGDFRGYGLTGCFFTPTQQNATAVHVGGEASPESSHL